MSDYRVAVTGRPEDLVINNRVIDLRPIIPIFFTLAVARAKREGRDRLLVITGGARGTDQLVAEYALEHPLVDGMKVAYWVVLPFPFEIMVGSGDGHYRWRSEHRERLARLIAGAEFVPEPINKTHAVWAYHRRNEYMVDHAETVVAFWNGRRSGGTYACIKYALLGAKPPRPVYNALAGYRLITPGQL